MNDYEIIEELFAQVEIMVLAVVLPDGKPWAVPIHIARREGLNVIEWDSLPDTEHSKAIELHPQIAITVFYEDTGFYARATAHAIPEQIDEKGRVRYRADISECWLNENRTKRKIEQ